jgi:hypothetical protein
MFIFSNNQTHVHFNREVSLCPRLTKTGREKASTSHCKEGTRLSCGHRERKQESSQDSHLAMSVNSQHKVPLVGLMISHLRSCPQYLDRWDTVSSVDVGWGPEVPTTHSPSPGSTPCRAVERRWHGHQGTAMGPSGLMATFLVLPHGLLLP